ncbi:MAG: hypothetical protein KatS3mg010_1126 [Acidimicrobiia bacterium]|nr:MAG: hypothetical protein KatS3mg010_1126 [Acidimicrobiia bacterium]
MRSARSSTSPGSNSSTFAPPKYDSIAVVRDATHGTPIAAYSISFVGSSPSVKTSFRYGTTPRSARAMIAGNSSAVRNSSRSVTWGSIASSRRSRPQLVHVVAGAEDRQMDLGDQVAQLRDGAHREVEPVAPRDGAVVDQLERRVARAGALTGLAKTCSSARFITTLHFDGGDAAVDERAPPVGR